MEVKSWNRTSGIRTKIWGHHIHELKPCEECDHFLQCDRKTRYPNYVNSTLYSHLRYSLLRLRLLLLVSSSLFPRPVSPRTEGKKWTLVEHRSSFKSDSGQYKEANRSRRFVMLIGQALVGVWLALRCVCSIDGLFKSSWWAERTRFRALIQSRAGLKLLNAICGTSM